VVALLTPNSLANDWVLSELGAAWANAKASIPLLVGGPTDRDIPGPLPGAAGGQLTAPGTLDRLLGRLRELLTWRARPDLTGKRDLLVEYARTVTFAPDPADAELKASFAAKRARIGSRQGQLLDYITDHLRGRPYLSLDNLADKGDGDGAPTFGWKLSEKYRLDIER
jgi:hypothetical protein